MAMLDVNAYKLNAYSDRVTYDRDVEEEYMEPVDYSPAVSDGIGDDLDAVEKKHHVAVKMRRNSPWESDIKGQISTKRWLQTYGLKKNKLDLNSLMNIVGFRKQDDYDSTLKKPISSKYGKNMFLQKWKPDGRTFNITASKEKVKQLLGKLTQCVELYKRRMQWISSESRRVFGVIQEACVVIILDVRNLSPQQFSTYISTVEKVLKDQVSRMAKFNLIRALDHVKCFQPKCVAVSEDMINKATEWLWSLERTATVSPNSTCEAVFKALEDKQAQGIYLFTEGCSSESSVELMLEKARSNGRSINVVSYNCNNSDILKGLRQLALSTDGRFHAYAVRLEMDSYEPVDSEEKPNVSAVSVRKRSFGGVPAGAGVQEDVMRLFEELEEGKNNLAQMTGLYNSIPASKTAVYTKTPASESVSHGRSEEYMGSAEWIAQHGIHSKKLDFFDVLSKVAFRHCDGVMEGNKQPGEEEYQTDAKRYSKLVNAKYCDQFAHIPWKDGTVVHVHVTPEIYRSYEQRVNTVLDKIDRRINWLRMGSRSVFGTIIEEDMYFLIDTSASMEPSMKFVRDSFFLLQQEQIRHKRRFNILAFNTKVIPWKDRLVEVSDLSLKSAWTWLQELECQGSTNTLAALQYALADPHVQSIYLLTDGRPDVPPKSVLAQVSLKNQIPVHTISFNCADREANQFLADLAHGTGGRYHCFSHGRGRVKGRSEFMNGMLEEEEGPQPWESEDIKALTGEFDKGKENVGKLSSLMDECSVLQWRKSTTVEEPKVSSSEPQFQQSAAGGLRRPKSSTNLRLVNRPAPSLRLSAGDGPHGSHVTPHSNHAALGYSTRSLPSRPAARPRPRSVAAHTRTSLLRTLSGSGGYLRGPSAHDWMLEESRSLVESQFGSPSVQQTPRTGRSSVPAEEPSARSPRSPTKSPRKPAPPGKLLSAKNWLYKNGLIPQRLTISDAISEAINRSSRPGLTVTSDRISDLMDSGSLTPRAQATKQRLLENVHLEAVLSDYEVKLAKKLTSFQKYREKLVWSGLTKAEKQKLKGNDGDLSVPLPFEDNRKELMESLRQSGAAVGEADIFLMDGEIRTAENYTSQSELLREACAERQRNRDHVGSSHDKSSKSPQHKPAMDRYRGRRIIGRNSEDGYYYQGSVICSEGSRRVRVRFDDLEETTLGVRQVEFMGGATPCPKLSIGDCTLALIRKGAGGSLGGPNLCYAPGHIIVGDGGGQDSGKFYSVMLYDDQEITSTRKDLVRVSRERYQSIVSYIEGLEEEQKQAHRPSGYGDEVDDDDVPGVTFIDGMERDKKIASILKHLKEKIDRHKNRQDKLKNDVRQLKSKLNADGNRQNQGGDTMMDSPGGENRDQVEIGEEVLTCWKDDGWYYRSYIRSHCGGYEYMVQDSNGDLQKTRRANIIRDKDDNYVKISPDSYVIAPHPEFLHSYAPAQLTSVNNEESCELVFYDGTRGETEREEVYLIDRERHDAAAQKIVTREKEMVGQSAVIRDDSTGVYKPGVIKKRVDHRRYLVETSAGTYEQTSIYILGVYAKQQHICVGYHCLAACESGGKEEEKIYCAGKVTAKKGSQLSIDFINGESSEDISENDCFSISHSYYDLARRYYDDHNAERDAGGQHDVGERSGRSRSSSRRSSLRAFSDDGRKSEGSKRSDGRRYDRDSQRSDQRKETEKGYSTGSDDLESLTGDRKSYHSDGSR